MLIVVRYDLGMSADDDGFAVMRTTGAAEGDLRVLAAKGFVHVVKPDELVTYILDWEKNNLIRKEPVCAKRLFYPVYQGAYTSIP